MLHLIDEPNSNAIGRHLKFQKQTQDKKLFVSELVKLMDPLLSGTLFPYSCSDERDIAKKTFEYIQNDARELAKCFSNSSLEHVKCFLCNFQYESPNISLENKEFIVNYASRDNPFSWLHCRHSSTYNRVPINDLMMQLQSEEHNDWLYDVINSESQRIQNRINQCKLRYGAIFNFLKANSSVVPMLLGNNFIQKYSELNKDDIDLNSE
ncbi:hypothetical protein cand_036780 [Cryptosporidium andersoni]|uniref:Uncharacterized protein n=1 Tax=Cryptosporidium andersoni TaxID=117008 RepID=A0A1J4MV70_9CRYT|nr:hypothetical protein cand_036780 [Cryptosporidium andersoni]